MTNTQRISIFGVTGSIGMSTISLILNHPGMFEVVALTGYKNGEKLAEVAIKTKAQYVVIGEKDQYPLVQKWLEGTQTRVLFGKEGMVDVAKIPVDIVVSAIVGFSGLESTYAAIPHCKKLALANKESIVIAGEQILSLASRYQTKILPVDSEHSAIFQVLEEENRPLLNKVTLTASGGPFLTLPAEDFAHITVEKALKHPNWVMGAKITIDCATLANKGLELIEAALLFHLASEKIEVLIHPQSIIHSLVSYQDGSVLAQLGNPDMRTAISYALFWPKRGETPVNPLDLAAIGTLSFEGPDLNRFPALKLARDALLQGQWQRIIFNAANEACVDSFLRGQISFIQIPQIIESMMGQFSATSLGSIEDVSQFNKIVYKEIVHKIEQGHF